MNHVMVDLETMSSDPTAAIISIGAVEFDPHGKTGLGREFYANVDLQSCLDLGLTVSGSTIMWWLEQSLAARNALKQDPKRVRDALESFGLWLPNNAVLWSHGAPFDLPILHYAYTKLGHKLPWAYKNELDTRTVFWMTGTNLSIQNPTVMHNALEDAKRQAQAIMLALKGKK